MNLKGLNPLEYEHPEDTAALEALERMPGVRDIAIKIWELWLDKLEYVRSTGSFIEINAINSKRLYVLFQKACDILDFKKIPPFYLQGDSEGNINAFARGVNRPYVAISYGCIERLNDDEMLFILGHELGHIKSGHVLYRTIAGHFNEYFNKLGSLSLGLSNLATIPAEAIDIAMNYWRRMSELSSDRAGLLVCNDIDIAITAIIKLSGFPSNDCSRISYLDVNKFTGTFKHQAREFKNFEMDQANKLARYWITKDISHPWNVLRVSELLKWIDSGNYERVINRERILIDDQEKYQIKSIPLNSKFCPNCGESICTNNHYCSGCGTQIEKKNENENQN